MLKSHIKCLYTRAGIESPDYGHRVIWVTSLIKLGGVGLVHGSLLQ